MNNRYIGNRYVPKLADTPDSQWDNSVSYESFEIVLHEGNSYTSKQNVPIGIDINNKSFWVNTGNFNAQLEIYKNAVDVFTTTYQNNLDNIENDITNIKASTEGNVININSYKNKVIDLGGINEDWSDAIQSAINDAYLTITNSTTVFFPEGTYNFTISPIIKNGITIKGSGMGSTILCKKGNDISVNPTFKVQTLHPGTGANYDNFDVDAVLRFQNPDGNYSRFNSVRDLMIKSLDNSTYGIYIPCSAQCYYNNVHIYNVKNCYYTLDSWKNSFDTIVLNKCEKGFVKSATYNNVGGPGDTYNNIFVEYFTKCGFELNRVSYTVFNNCLCQDFTNANPFVFRYADSISMNGCAIEGGQGSSIDIIDNNTYGAFVYADNSFITINGFANSAGPRTGSLNPNTSLFYLNSSKILINGYVGYVSDMKNSHNFILQNNSILDISSNSYYYTANIVNLFDIVENSKIIDRRIKIGDITLYVDNVNGTDTRILADSGDYSHKFKTIKACLNYLPKNIDGNITIQIISNTYNEIVDISNFKGNGSIKLRGNSGFAIIDGLIIKNNEVQILTEIMKVVFNSSNHNNGIGIYNDNSKSNMVNTSVEGFINTDYCGVKCSNSSYTILQNSTISNNYYGILVDNNSKILSINNSGTGNTNSLYAKNCSLIGKNGTQPTGTTQETILYGGQII